MYLYFIKLLFIEQIISIGFLWVVVQGIRYDVLGQGSVVNRDRKEGGSFFYFVCNKGFFDCFDNRYGDNYYGIDFYGDNRYGDYCSLG